MREQVKSTLDKIDELLSTLVIDPETILIPIEEEKKTPTE